MSAADDRLDEVMALIRVPAREAGLSQAEYLLRVLRGELPLPERPETYS